jgi:hypothetical protein
MLAWYLPLVGTGTSAAFWLLGWRPPPGPGQAVASCLLVMATWALTTTVVIRYAMPTRPASSWPGIAVAGVFCAATVILAVCLPATLTIRQSELPPDAQLTGGRFGLTMTGWACGFASMMAVFVIGHRRAR